MAIKTRKELKEKTKEKEIDNFIMGKDLDNEENFCYLTTKINQTLHGKLKAYCAINKLKMNDTVVSLIEEFIRKEGGK